MSIELANDARIIGQIASNQGYSDLIKAVKALQKTPANMPLIVFVERGFTTSVDSCVKALETLKGGSDVVSTAKGMAKLMDGEDFAVITDGTSSD